jgi:murein DD-endopeptidase MepM/ murein hydrolase activator NlpD
MNAVVVGTNVYGWLGGSVGLGGFNNPEDVGAVQQLLKNKGYYGQSRIDKDCGPFTIQAIKAFQAKYVMRNPDGLIQPGRGTWHKLIDLALCLVRTGHPASATATRLAPAVASSSTSRTLPEGVRWPLQSNKIRRGMTNHTFGLVRNNNTKPHQGWDLYAISGTECYAIANGQVVGVRDQGDYGKQLVIKLDSVQIENQTVYAFYAHLSEITAGIAINTTVNKGQLIGKTGNTGNASTMTGLDQHLHFELRKDIWPQAGNPSNPQSYFARRFNPTALFGSAPLQTAVLAS